MPMPLALLEHDEQKYIGVLVWVEKVAVDVGTGAELTK
jgi:hypothetical protein